MQKLGARYSNPISQFFIKFSDFLVKPTARVLPGFHGFDIGILCWFLVFQFIMTFLVVWLEAGFIPNLGGIIITALGRGLQLVLYVYLVAIIIRAVMSWFVNPYQSAQPAAELIYLLTEPPLRFFQRFIPLIAGFDFSPFVMIILIEMINAFGSRVLILTGLQIAIR